MGFDAPRTQTQRHTHLHPEFVFHILSTGCVMTPVIKAGNCLTVVLRYWIRGQLGRHNWRQLDVKSLSSEIGSRAEQTHRRWYQHQREMLALYCLTLVNGIQPTCYPIPSETLTDSVPLPLGTRHSMWLQQLLQRSSTDHLPTKAYR